MLYEVITSITPYIVPAEPRTLEEGEYLQTPLQKAQYDQFADCINCMCCYAACPQYGLNPEFTGPGVLALLHRYNAKKESVSDYWNQAVLAIGTIGLRNVFKVLKRDARNNFV